MSLMPWMEMGFNVVNVEYRLARVALAPAAVEDCLCALRYINNQAKTYDIDTTRLILTGESAGGHLALTTGIIPETAGLDRECAGDPGRPDGNEGLFRQTKTTVGGGVMNVKQALYPSFAMEGWTRHEENIAKPPLMERTGWLFQATTDSPRTVRLIGGLKQPPRLRQLRNGTIFLYAQPPLLREGGVYPGPIPGSSTSTPLSQRPQYSPS